CDRKEEATTLTEILAQESESMHPRELRLFQERLASVLKKFAHRKYRRAFEESSSSVQHLVASNPGRFALLARRLQEIERVAGLRFAE
ncbi:MAG TPA: hypothetical protein VMW69_16320, partial [Spirochaetia bacterium]|nr:hypothetical protein [Spirochaetia bacterium]